MKDIKDKILERVTSIQENDAALAKEFQQIRKNDQFIEKASALASKLPKSTGALEGIDHDFALETIVLRVGRPVLAIFKDDAVLEFKDAESAVWKTKLVDAEPLLKKASQSIGRIEVANHPYYSWLGTGWLVDAGVIVTNRHVAEIFGRSDGQGFVFRQGSDGGLIRASIDFIEEIARPDDFTFTIEDILHIEGDSGPDIAFLKVKPAAGKTVPQPISLSSSAAQTRQDIAVIGYPASDSRIPDQQLMTDIFGNVYDKKRLAPGQLTSVSATQLLHDCSTLGGNSGSPLIDLITGEALGLHFAGRFMESNFAVPAAVIAQRLKALGNGAATTGTPNGAEQPTQPHQPAGPQPPTQPHQLASPQPVAITGPSTITIDYLLPLTITFSVGAITAKIPAPPPPTQTGATEAEEFFTEGSPADYSDRTGYDPNFLGKKFKVPLPEISNKDKKKDILKFTLENKEQQVLNYEHFSVTMSKSRRQCFYSAVNIDGKTSVGMKRGAWRTDPRIPADAQILKECYGNSPMFSRGHMTRREDPIWGGAADAALGNSDSMHVTNTVPQVQGLNGGIWLGLENYALQNARKDDMRISVFTGPVFTPGDPVQFGIKIPRSFWKIIIFIHDATHKLCATGYEISQEPFLTNNEFIFGQHNTAQRKISQLEKETGISFGELSSIDPLNTTEELPDAFLSGFEQIKFI